MGNPLAWIAARARDLAAAAAFARVALNPRGARGAAYRFETGLFFRSSIPRIGRAKIALAVRCLLMLFMTGIALLAVLAWVSLDAERAFISLPLSALSPQIPPCAVFQPRAHASSTGSLTLDRAIERSGPPFPVEWQATRWESLRSQAASAGSSELVVSRRLYDKALEMSAHSSRAPLLGSYVPSASRPLNAKAPPSFHARCLAIAQLFLNDQRHEQRVRAFTLPYRAAIFRALARGPEFLDLHAAARATVARSGSRASAQPEQARALSDMMEEDWATQRELARALAACALLMAAMLFPLSFLSSLALEAARFFTGINDPAALSRIARAELSDQLPPSSSHSPTRRARRL